MKKITTILFLCLLGVMSHRPVTTHAFAGGDGSVANPWQITTVAELQAIGTSGDWDDAYLLMNDLDLTGVDWVALGSSGSHLFTGVFDGNDNQIKGLSITIDDPSAEVVSSGFFYALGQATIKNLVLSNVDIEVSVKDADLYVGAIAGRVLLNDGEQVLIDRVSVNGSLIVNYDYTAVEAHDRHIGGILGELADDEDADSPSTCSNNNVRLDLTVNFDQNFSDWYSFTDDLSIGGMIGYASNVLFQSNVLSNSNLDLITDVSMEEWSPVYLGGIVGLYETDIDFTLNDREVFLDHSIRNSELHGVGHVGGMVGSYQSDLDNKVREVAISDVVIDAHFHAGGVFGTLHHLTLTNARVTNLEMTILSESSTYFGGVFADGWNTNFEGVMSVDGFTFRKSDPTHSVGTIGGIGGLWYEGTSNAIVTVNNLDLIANNTLGGVFGAVQHGVINQAKVTNTVIDGSNQVGGIVGGTQLGLVLDNVTFDGTLKGNNVGGIVGYLDGKTTISHAAALGEYTLSANGYFLGGLIGHSIYNWNEDDTLTVTDSYCRADLYYPYDGSFIGGLIGGASYGITMISNPITLNHVYYAGHMILINDPDHPASDSPHMIDPILGYDRNPGNHSFSHVFYDKTLVTLPNNAGIGIGLTTTDMMTASAYEDFDFTGLDHWFIYPGFNEGYATFNPGLVRIDFTDHDGKLLNIQFYQPGSPITLPSAPTRSGYTFVQWLTLEDQPFDVNANAETSQVLKASYKEGLPDTGVSSKLWLLPLLLGILLMGISVRRKPKQN